jgi:hypothetical protein
MSITLAWNMKKITRMANRKEEKQTLRTNKQADPNPKLFQDLPVGRQGGTSFTIILSLQRTISIKKTYFSRCTN